MRIHSPFLFFGHFVVLICLSACGKSDIEHSSTLFTLTSNQSTLVNFVNQVPDQAANGLNIIQYLYYYNGGGIAATDLNGDSLPDLYFSSNLGPDALYINRGNFKFDSVQLEYPLNPATKWTTGVTYADVNLDGRTDLYVCQVGNYKAAQGRNLLFINEGNDPDGKPRFSEQAEKYGLALSAFCTQAAFFDYDRDGDLDCFILCHSVHSAGVYRDTAQTRKFDPLAADRLYRNDGGHFTDIGQKLGIYGGLAGYGLGLSISDLNGDGWPDIYIGNDFHESDYLYLNQQGKSFKEVASTALGHTSNFTMGTDIADINQDGRMDIISLDMLPPDEYTRKASQPVDQLDIYEFKHQLGYHYQYPRNALQVNLGNNEAGLPMFAEIGQFAGLDATDWSWSPLLADFDLDGKTDIYITNGIRRRGNHLDFLKFNEQSDIQRTATDTEIANRMPEGKVPNAAFRNLGDNRFESVEKAWGLDLNGFSNGAAYADLDADGDLDLIVNNLNAPASIYQNNASHQKRLSIRLEGRKENRLGIGARIRVHEKHFVREYELMPSRGFQSASESVLHIGLNKAGENPWIGVLWPDGSFSEANVHVNDTSHTSITISQTAQTKRPTWLWPSQTPWIDAESGIATKYLPKAECTKQSVSQKLVPWNSMARFGKVYPSANGRTCIPGSKPKVFDLQSQQSQNILTNDVLVSAAFADANHDGHEELIACIALANGIYEVRCFRLVGKVWQPDAQAWYLGAEIAVIAPADADADGDIDFFLGAAQSLNGYGVEESSVVLRNEGMGKFTTERLACGMVRDAAWADLNRDEKPELVVVSEWKPIMVYNKNDQWLSTTIPATEGLWQSLLVVDVNQDGFLDLVAGNLGENTRLRPSETTPAWLLIGDFDGNQQTDPIVGYHHQGVPYVLADRDLLATQLPGIKKKYPQYEAYARAKFDEVFPPSANTSATHRHTATRAASVALINPGSSSKAWDIEILPQEVQWSSVNALLDWKDGTVIAGGNMTDVQPYLGRQDAGMVYRLKRLGNQIWQAKPLKLDRTEVRRLVKTGNTLWIGE
jgi:enediyne biosynthesis protein E4